MATLIATLGKSPVVVTSTANLLKRSGIKLDKVKIIYPSEASMIDVGVALIEDVLTNKLGIPVEKIGVNEEDFNTTESINHFFWFLNEALRESQENNEEIYISIAGGRKGTSAVGLLVAQLFPNVKKVLHIIDEREEEENIFYTIEQLFDMSKEKREGVMLPDPSKQNLIELPFYSLIQGKDTFKSIENALRNFPNIDRRGMDLLRNAKLLKDDELTDYGEFIRDVLSKKTYPEIRHLYLSPQAKKILLKLPNNYLSVVTDNLNMFFNSAKVNSGNRVKTLFRKKINGSERNIKVSKFFKGRGRGDLRNTVRMFFYIDRDSIYLLDIYFHESSPLLNKFTGKNYDKEEENDFHTLKMNIANRLYGREEDFEDYKEIKPHSATELIASLGLSPGIIIEAYEKLKERADIKRIYVVYPERNNEIYQNLSKIKGLMKRGLIEGIPVEGVKDIDSIKATIKFERTVNNLIKGIPLSHKIYMLISGGRKTMSASMLRVASLQNSKNEASIEAYHILVEDEALEERINRAIEEEDRGRLNTLLKDGKDKLSLFMVPVDFG